MEFSHSSVTVKLVLRRIPAPAESASSPRNTRMRRSTPGVICAATVCEEPAEAEVGASARSMGGACRREGWGLGKRRQGGGVRPDEDGAPTRCPAIKVPFDHSGGTLPCPLPLRGNKSNHQPEFLCILCREFRRVSL